MKNFGFGNLNLFYRIYKGKFQAIVFLPTLSIHPVHEEIGLDGRLIKPNSIQENPLLMPISSISGCKGARNAKKLVFN